MGLIFVMEAGKTAAGTLYFASLIYKNYIYIRNYLEGLVANGYSANDILLALDKRNVSPMGSKSTVKILRNTRMMCSASLS